MNTDDMPAWGVVIETARLARRPKLSARKAAEAAGISEGRWRQITKGYQAAGGGRIPVPGPAETLARMAEVVGVDADAMEEAGRPDVASEMRMLRSVGVTESGDLWLSDSTEEIALLREWLELDSDESPPTKALLLWTWDQLMEAAAAKVRDEMELKDYFISMLSNRPTQAKYDELVAQLDGGDGDADDTRGSAPIGLAEAAHEETHTIEDEQADDSV